MGVHPAEARAAGFGLDVIEIDPGQILEELPDVAVGDIAENVGRDRSGNVHVAPLVHDRLGITFALGRHVESGQLQDFPCLRRAGRGSGRGADQIDLADRGLTRGDGQRFFDGVVAGVGDRNRRAAGGDTHELERPVVFGVGHLVGAVQSDFGVADIFPADRVENTALDRAGRLRLGRHGGRQPTTGEHEEFLPVQKRGWGGKGHGIKRATHGFIPPPGGDRQKKGAAG